MLPTPESLGLPSKPVTVTAPVKGPLPSTIASTSASASTTTTTPAPAASSASADPTVCAHCSTPPKYTCPRCSTRTCSLPCSKLHKSSTGCSGIRDPAAFVPLNKITQGTWDADYAWLEERRRQVAAWGEGVTPDEATRVGLNPNDGRGGAGGRGGGAGGRGGKAGGAGGLGRQKKSKLDGLRWAVGEIGAEVDILPDGMARRRTNQSSWNPKTRSLNLTIQFDVPAHNDDPTLLSHPRVAVLPRADPPLTLRSLLPERLHGDDFVLAVGYHVPRWRMRQKERNERNERWERSRAGDGASGNAGTSGTPNTTSATTAAATPATPDTAAVAPSGKKFFPPLDPTKPLDAVFAGTVWIEFPTVHVIPRAEWDAMDKVVMPPFESENKRKAAPEDEQGGAKRVKVEGAAAEGASAVAVSVARAGSGSASVPASASAPAPLVSGGIAALGDYESDDEIDDAIDDDEDDDAEGGDIELSPEMAAALGKALVADFGEQ